ncbi:MAG: hypothetical protein AAF270_14105, partial [Pseudomonadota bacterium]
AQITATDRVANTVTVLGRVLDASTIAGAAALQRGDFAAFQRGTGRLSDELVSATRVGGWELTGVAQSFVSGSVESVDTSLAVATVDGFLIDYAALMGVGYTPSVGDYLDVSGYGYDQGLVAAPIDTSTLAQ